MYIHTCTCDSGQAVCRSIVVNCTTLKNTPFHNFRLSSSYAWCTYTFSLYLYIRLVQVYVHVVTVPLYNAHGTCTICVYMYLHVYVCIWVNAHFHMQYQITPLHWASARGHYDVAQLLLEKGAELDARTDVSIMCLFSSPFYCMIYQ